MGPGKDPFRKHSGQAKAAAFKRRIFPRRLKRQKLHTMHTPPAPVPFTGARLKTPNEEVAMIIKVFGPGCSKCKETEHIVREAVETSGMTATVEKVTDLRAMMAAGVLSTPAVSINGSLACSGRVPSREEVVSWIMTAAEKEK